MRIPAPVLPPAKLSPMVHTPRLPAAPAERGYVSVVVAEPLPLILPRLTGKTVEVAVEFRLDAVTIRPFAAAVPVFETLTIATYWFVVVFKVSD